MDLFLHYLSLPYLLKGIGFTVAVTALGLAGGLVVGLVLASMQLSKVGPLAAFARGYTVIFRGTPLILQLVFAYDALPHIGLKLSAIGAAGLALALNEGPFIAEILRAGVLGVDRGQLLAGQALGMTPAVMMRRVIAPQAIRTMVPALGNESVSALKNSSLASVIAVDELTLRSTQLASSTFDFFSIFFASGLIYLVLTGAIALIQLVAEAGLDLDRPAGERFARLLPWRRAQRLDDVPSAQPVPGDGVADATAKTAAVAAPGADPLAARAPLRLVAGGPREALRGTREASCRGARHGPAQALRQADRARSLRSDRANRRSDRVARPKRFGQEHAAALYQPSRAMGCGPDSRRRAAAGGTRRRAADEPPRRCQRTRERRRRHGVPAVQPV
jgi:polar amino acid transport system permease protein